MSIMNRKIPVTVELLNDDDLIVRDWDNFMTGQRWRVVGANKKGEIYCECWDRGLRLQYPHADMLISATDTTTFWKIEGETLWEYMNFFTPCETRKRENAREKKREAEKNNT
jgi:hypothetical protein